MKTKVYQLLFNVERGGAGIPAPPVTRILCRVGPVCGVVGLEVPGSGAPSLGGGPGWGSQNNDVDTHMIPQDRPAGGNSSTGRNTQFTGPSLPDHFRRSALENWAMVSYNDTTFQGRHSVVSGRMCYEF